MGHFTEVLDRQREINRLLAEIERLRSERDMVNESLQAVCDELGCPYDNEAALMAIHALFERVAEISS